jgi:hypothetical protein
MEKVVNSISLKNKILKRIKTSQSFLRHNVKDGICCMTGNALTLQTILLIKHSNYYIIPRSLPPIITIPRFTSAAKLF